MRVLLIDDKKDVTADVVARTYLEGIKALRSEKFDLLYLDHDLGDFDKDKREWTGMDILKWLAENPKHLPGRIQVITFNRYKVDEMEERIRDLYGG